MLDASLFREAVQAFGGGLREVYFGLAKQPEGEAAHYVAFPNAAQPDAVPHVRLFVEIQPDEKEVRCMLACPGIWRVPAVDEAVLVFVPGGELSDERMGPVCLSLADLLVFGWNAIDTIVFANAGGKVRLGAGSGTQPTVLGTDFMADYTALKNHVYTHTHYAPSGGGPTTSANEQGVVNPPFGTPGHEPPGENPGSPYDPPVPLGTRIANPDFDDGDPYALDPETGRPYPETIEGPPAAGSGFLSAIAEVI